MDFIKAWLFNRMASSPKSKPKEVLDSLVLKPGQNIADIGVGGGYFSFKFAEAVGKGGIVYAVDKNLGFLDLLAKNAEKKGVLNIKTLPTSELNHIPENSLDYVFLRNVYHHLEDRTKYFNRISRLLKQEGKVAVIEYKAAKGFSFHKLFGHHTVPAEVIKEMSEAGYAVDKSYDFLSEQSFTVFKKRIGNI
jgi:ubiquinone/menaquinone biosynthesis C-methylase UbiE